MMDLCQFMNEEKKERRGGVRVNAGRPAKEIATRSVAKQICDYVDEKERIKLIARAKEMAWNDPIMMKFILEQIYGKAAQALMIDSNNTIDVNVHFVLHNQPRHLSSISSSGTREDSRTSSTV